MADEQRPGIADPFDAFRKLYAANEELWTKTAKESMGTDAFAEAGGKMLETFLAFQKASRDAMSTQLSALNLASRDDVARLGEIVLGMEEKIDRLIDALGPSSDPPRPKPRGSRAAKPAASTPAR